MTRFLLSICGFFLLAAPAYGDLSREGAFQYTIFSNDDEPVGDYGFTIHKVEEGLRSSWEVASALLIQTTVFFLKVFVKTEDRFVFDGQRIREFVLHDVRNTPFSFNKDLTATGRIEDGAMSVKLTDMSSDATISEKEFATSEFESIRNLSSRVVRPENVLKPGERVVQRVLDPLEMKIIEVVGLGVGVKSISFGGQQRDVFEIKRSHASYELSEFKFADGLIYRVNMGRGYSRLKENHK